MKPHYFSFKLDLRLDSLGSCPEKWLNLTIGPVDTIQLKPHRFIVFDTIRAQSGRKPFQGHFELRIMYSALTQRAGEDWGLGVWDWGFGVGVWGFRFEILGLEFGIWGLGFRVEGLKFGF